MNSIIKRRRRFTGGIPSYSNLYSVSFDGTDDQVKIGNDIFQNKMRGNFTITTWLNIPSTGAQVWFGAGGTGDFCYAHYSGTALQFQFQCNSDLGWYYSSGFSAPTSTFFHLAITAEKGESAGDNTVFKAYLNGSEATGTSGLHGANITKANHETFDMGENTFDIGKVENVGGRMLNGTLMHDFSLHSETLSSAAILALYNSGVPINQLETSGNYSHTDLEGYWKLDEGEGTVVDDSKGSQSGNFVNGPTWTTTVP